MTRVSSYIRTRGNKKHENICFLSFARITRNAVTPIRKMKEYQLFLVILFNMMIRVKPSKIFVPVTPVISVPIAYRMRPETRNMDFRVCCSHARDIGGVWYGC